MINIIFGVQMPGTASIDQIRKIASPENTIIFNTEQLTSNSPWVTNEYLSLLKDHGVLDYHQSNVEHIKKIKGHDQPKAFEFPLIPSENFSRDYKLDHPIQSINFDLAFYGSINLGDRLSRLTDLENKNIRIKYISGAYGNLLPKSIIDCTGVLNIHGYESGLFEVVRCLRPASLLMPIFSDISVQPSLVKWEEGGIFFIERADFHKEITRHLRCKDSLLQASHKMRDFITDLSWKKKCENIMQDIINSTSIQ